MDRLEIVLDRLGKIEERQIKQGEVLAVNTQSLVEHMRRTDLLERRMERMDEDTKPIRAHVAFINISLKVLGVLAAGAGLAASIVKVLEFLS